MDRSACSRMYRLTADASAASYRCTCRTIPAGSSGSRRRRAPKFHGRSSATSALVTSGPRPGVSASTTAAPTAIASSAQRALANTRSYSPMTSSGAEELFPAMDPTTSTGRFKSAHACCTASRYSTWPGVIAEHERALGMRRERRTRKEPARVHGVVDHARQVLGNAVFLGQALETVVVNGHVTQNSTHAWRGGHVRPPVVTHEQTARIPKLQ